MSVTALYNARVASGQTKHDDAQAAAAERLSDLAVRIEGWSPSLRSRIKGLKGPAERGIYLHGAVGRGKSMLMDMFFETAEVEKKRRVHFHAFMQDVHARIRAAREAQEEDVIAAVGKTVTEESWLLCFDELEVTNIADATILGRLFEALFERGVVLVTTSNRPPDDLYKDGQNRALFLPFIALIKERLEIVELDASRDYRLTKHDADATWFAPLGPEADAGLDALWKRLTQGEGERAEEIAVQGRTLAVPRAAAGAARFTFEELCAAALGPADYLALAERYSTIVLDRIPKLGAERRNEAKRFMTLIDALYEAKTKLAASAAAEPSELYVMGDGSFEFARTASRLIEMRSKEYLAEWASTLKPR